MKLSILSSHKTMMMTTEEEEMMMMLMLMRVDLTKSPTRECVSRVSYFLRCASFSSLSPFFLSFFLFFASFAVVFHAPCKRRNQRDTITRRLSLLKRSHDFSSVRKGGEAASPRLLFKKARDVPSASRVATGSGRAAFHPSLQLLRPLFIHRS